MPGFVVAENLARDPRVVQQVTEDLLPLMETTRDDRTTLRNSWLRYHRIWSVKHELQGYRGRTNTYLPLGRRWIENWVRRLARDLFPDGEWFQTSARRELYEARVPGIQAIHGYFFRKQMRLQRQMPLFLRQLVTYGTAPVRNVWHLQEREQQILRDLFDAEGRPTGQWERTVEKIVDFIGPTFRPVDLFAFYVWPTTAMDVDDATLTFEDMLVQRDVIRARASQPLDPRDPKGKKYGRVYENTEDLFTAVDRNEQGGKAVAAGSDKFQAEQQRLADKGFTHPLDQRLPPSMRPIDLTEAMWHADLGDGAKKYLVTIGHDRTVLRVQENPQWHGRGLHLVGKFVEVVNEFYGRGLPELFEHMQYFANDLANQTGDALIWSTNPIAVIDMGAVQDPDSLRMAPGAKWLANPNGIQFTQPPQGPAQAGLGALGQVVGMADSFANVTPAGALGSASRGRGRSQSTASGMQMLLAEGSVDIRDVVANIEQSVLVPLLERNHIMAMQFLDRSLVLKIAGADGATVLDTPIGVADLVGDYQFEWLGSLQALNTQVRGQQMINFLGMVAKLPPDALQSQNIEIDLKTLLRDIYGQGLGLRNAEGIVRDKTPMKSLDWRLENDLFRAGMGVEVQVSPKDPHLEHAKGHDLLLRDPGIDPRVKTLVMQHVQQHLAAMVAAQMAAQMPPAQPGMPGPGGPGGPPPGGMMPGGPRLPAPMGPGRMAQTGGFDDLLRQLPREGM